MDKEGIKSYKDLIVWQKSIFLVKEVYTLTEDYPREELFGLVSQMRRAAVSIPSNIAEGKCRGTRKDYAYFLTHAFGSGAELETQIIISKMQIKTSNLNYRKTDEFLDEVMRMLNRLIKT